MAVQKAAIFVDNSNVFKGAQGFSKYLVKKGELRQGQYLRIKWGNLLKALEAQNGGLDIYARHFFASLPPAADVSGLKTRPTEQQWAQMVKESAQSGFYKVVQNPPLNFTLHGIPLRFKEVHCRERMRYAYSKCIDSYGGKLQCGVVMDPETCYACDKLFLYKYEKGVDVALAAQLVIIGGQSSGLDRIILMAGDGDYKQALHYVRRDVGRDVQLVSWRRPLSGELRKLANKAALILDDHWKELCEVRAKPPLDEMPAIDENEL